jgi:hypothetical protein
MTDIRITNDDITPRLRDAGVATELTKWLQDPIPEDVLLWIINHWGRVDLNLTQLKQLIAELKLVGDLPQAAMAGDSLPEVEARPAAPTGIGIGSGNVWATPPGETYVFRFYVNGTLKTTLQSYYITSLESIGAVPGDVVQICIMGLDSNEKPICGWWARKSVP